MKYSWLELWGYVSKEDSQDYSGQIIFLCDFIISLT